MFGAFWRVIGGMDPEFQEQLYHAGRAMDAAGLQWSMLTRLQLRAEHRGTLHAASAETQKAWEKAQAAMDAVAHSATSDRRHAVTQTTQMQRGFPKSAGRCLRHSSGMIARNITVLATLRGGSNALGTQGVTLNNQDLQHARGHADSKGAIAN
jgi:hypothetical protein